MQSQSVSEKKATMADMGMGMGPDMGGQGGQGAGDDVDERYVGG